RPDDPRTPPGRTGKAEASPSAPPPQPRGGAVPGNPGALPRRTGEAPRAEQSARDHELPQVHPPGPAGELPRVGTPGQPGELPRTAQPGRNVEVPRTQERGKGNQGAAPRGDQPTFRGAPARGAGAGEAPCGPPRPAGQQDSGGKGQPSSGAKGKARPNDKG